MGDLRQRIGDQYFVHGDPIFFERWAQVFSRMGKKKFHPVSNDPFAYSKIVYQEHDFKTPREAQKFFQETCPYGLGDGQAASQCR